MAANLTQILNLKHNLNFHKEFKLFLKLFPCADNGRHLKIVCTLKNIIIYVWKMLESKVLNFNSPIISLWNERRGHMCGESHVATGHLGSICYNIMIN